MNDKIKSKIITPEMCECGRFYKDRRNKDGKMMCSACHTGLDIESLKKLWGTSVKKRLDDKTEGAKR